MVRPESDPNTPLHPAAEPGTVVLDRGALPDAPLPGPTLAALDRYGAGQTGETCDRCGMAAVVERKCKVICLNCGTILQSCADL